MTMWAPPAVAWVSAAFKLVRTSVSNSIPVRPAKPRGGTLNSML